MPFWRLLLIAVIMTFSWSRSPAQTRFAPAPPAAAQNFAPDAKIQAIATAYAQDMVDYAQSRYQIQLDGTDQSIEQIEKIATQLHEAYVKQPPTEDQLNTFIKMLGSYTGEVYRKNHGAEWGWVTLNGNRFPGLRRQQSKLFWPWGKARDRIINGKEDNLFNYYKYLADPDFKTEKK